MDDPGNLVRTESKPFRWKRLLITLALGSVPTIVFFLFDLWVLGSIFLLLTLLLACFAFPSKLHAIVLTMYTVFALAWIAGSLIDSRVVADWDAGAGVKLGVAAVGGAAVGLSAVVLFWFAILFVSTKWILAVSDSLDIPWKEAFRFVATRAFDTAQAYVIVENGKVAGESKKGIFSRLGGPGVLVVQPGNAVALERGGKVTRIVGPGVYQLKRFEYIKKPVSKGVVDLRTQFSYETASEVLTRDGIPLDIKAVSVYQIEPCKITDQRPASHFAGGEATTPVLGAPEYPVYEATVHKAVYATTPDGWHSLFPWGPFGILRDIVAAYTLEQLFPPGQLAVPDPDQRALKVIEDHVKRRFDPSGSGVWLLAFDVLEVSMPKEVRERVLKQWTARVEYELKVAEADADRRATIHRSEGQAEALDNVERVKYAARARMVEVIQELLAAVNPLGREQVALGFINVVQQLTERVGQDDSVTMRYVEAMQAIVQADGPKSFVITPPNPSPGVLPAAPQPSPPQTRLMDGQRRGGQKGE